MTTTTEEQYKEFDKERITNALAKGDFKAAITFFNYSALTTDEFEELCQSYLTPGYDDLQAFLKRKDEERIRKALTANQAELVELIVKTSALTRTEVADIKKDITVQTDYHQAFDSGNVPLDDMREKVLNYISSQISAPSYDTWMKKIYFEKQAEKALIVYCPNEFARDWLEERYAALINEAVKLVVGTETELVFKLSPQKEDTFNSSL
ncbi:DnaA N-terminal domain-containing protein [Niallia taxi]|uniref:DnaA N-terminal domain-containing protein n=1 Tax=Niallia taxi TaxID=2499688 RepID=UPI003D2B0099